MRSGRRLCAWLVVTGLVMGCSPRVFPQADELPFEVPEYPIPEDNAWDYMMRAGEVLRESDGESGWNLIMAAEQEGMTPDYTEVVKGYLPALEVLRDGLYLPCRVPDVGPEAFRGGAVFPELAPLRGMARGLSMEAQARVQEGKWDEAVTSAQDCLRLGANVSRNGTVIHQLVSWAINAIGAAALDRVLVASEPSAQRLIEFARWNEENRAEQQSLAETMAIETRLKLNLMRQVTPEQYAAHMAQVMEWAEQPPHARGDPPEAPWGQGFHFSLTDEEIWARTAEKRLVNETSLAGMSVRCALEAHRKQEGRYPRSLAPLAPDYLAEVPDDPCSGEGFRYVLRRLDGTGGYELYSVGPDRDDDGGKLVWNREDGDGDLLIAPEWKIHGSRPQPEGIGEEMPVEVPVERPVPPRAVPAPGGPGPPPAPEEVEPAGPPQAEGP